MRNSVKKAAVTALVCVTAAGMMAGCGNKKLDGTKIAVTGNPVWRCKSGSTYAAGTG